MMTLEQAINRLEDMVSGRYQQKFPKSELRTNTKDSAELIRFSLMSLLKLKKDTVREEAYNTILNTVLDDTPLPASWQKEGMKDYFDYCRSKKTEHRILKYPDVLEECIECCNVILQRIEEEITKEDDQILLQELNRKYFHKFLYFRDDEIGSQYVWIKNIHKNEKNHFAVDGTVIYTNGPKSNIGLYEVADFPIEDFYCFGDRNKRFTRVVDLDNALQTPMDTRLKNHIISAKDVVEDVMFIFTWFYEKKVPEIAKILKTVKFD